MGNSPSLTSVEKEKDIPIKKSSLKSKAQEIIPKSQKSITKKEISDSYNKEPLNTIPDYHLSHKAQINSGMNRYQYFNQPVPNTDITNKFGIDTTQDNKYSHSIDKLYKQEINYRTNVDCSKEIPVTQTDIKDTLTSKSDKLDDTNNYHNKVNINSNFDNSAQIPQEDISNKQNSEDQTCLEITITREQAIEIKNCRYLSDLEKRILIMNSITLQEIDPLNMLEDNRIRLNVLTDKYKSLLKIYHPDRAGASSHDMFVTVKDAFDKQQYVINSKIMDKDYNQLKQDYSEYSQNIKKKKPNFFNGKNSIDEFDSKKFNEFYEKNKYHDEYEDDGYGHIMVEGGVREDIEIEKISVTKDNTFQDQFNKKVNSEKSEIIKYQVPKPVNQYGNYSQICQKTNNYSGVNSNVNCFDYKEAFELMNIDRNKPTTNMSLEEYKKARKNDSLELTDEQRETIEKDDIEEENKEKDRQNNMVDYSNSLERYNFKINKIMLEN